MSLFKIRSVPISFQRASLYLFCQPNKDLTMAKDLRYKTLRVMIETGNTQSLVEVFNIIPKTVIAADLGINYTRFLSRLRKPDEFTLNELIRLASLIEVENKVLLNLVLAEIEGKKAGRKKR